MSRGSWKSHQPRINAAAEQAERLYREPRATLKSVAAAMGLSHEHVRNLLKRRGVPLRAWGRHSHHPLPAQAGRAST